MEALFGLPANCFCLGSTLQPVRLYARFIVRCCGDPRALHPTVPSESFASVDICPIDLVDALPVTKHGKSRLMVVLDYISKAVHIDVISYQHILA